MATPELLPLLYLLFGLAIGTGLGFGIFRLQLGRRWLERNRVAREYVSVERYQALQQQHHQLQRAQTEAGARDREMAALVATLEAEAKQLRERLGTQQQEMQRLQQEAQHHFERVANRLFEEKSNRFSEQSQERIGHLLQPLQQQLVQFGQEVQHKFAKQREDQISLREEIKLLRGLNENLSLEARNLVSALRGDTKQQGDWGEWQLELLLERAGLQRDVHFSLQNSYRNANGQQRRPDCIIHLPEEKKLIIDSKVSLMAYEQWCQAETPEAQQQSLQGHLASLRRHIRELGAKNYQQLYQIQAPDYVLLYIPIEPAFSAALGADQQLMGEALDRNIVLVTTSTLLATLRTVSYIWKQERQKQNVQEIARQSGLLYDKFCNFVEDLRDIGFRLDQAQQAYAAAFNKLRESPKKGDTLIGRAERIRELGAQHAKQLPPELLGSD